MAVGSIYLWPRTCRLPLPGSTHRLTSQADKALCMAPWQAPLPAEKRTRRRRHVFPEWKRVSAPQLHADARQRPAAYR